MCCCIETSSMVFFLLYDLMIVRRCGKLGMRRVSSGKECLGGKRGQDWAINSPPGTHFAIAFFFPPYESSPSLDISNGPVAALSHIVPVMMPDDRPNLVLGGGGHRVAEVTPGTTNSMRSGTCKPFFFTSHRRRGGLRMLLRFEKVLGRWLWLLLSLYGDDHPAYPPSPLFYLWVPHWKGRRLQNIAFERHLPTRHHHLHPTYYLVPGSCTKHQCAPSNVNNSSRTSRSIHYRPSPVQSSEPIKVLFASDWPASVSRKR